MDALDVVFPFKRLEAAIEDRLVEVCTGLNGADPDTRATSRVDHIVDQAFVGAQILKSEVRGKKKISIAHQVNPLQSRPCILFSILPRDDLPGQAVIFLEKPEQLLVHERLGALEEQRKVGLGEDAQAQQFLLVEEMIRRELGQTSIVELRGELVDRAARRSRGSHSQDEETRSSSRNTVTERVYEKACSARHPNRGMDCDSGQWASEVPPGQEWAQTGRASEVKGGKPVGDDWKRCFWRLFCSAPGRV